MPHRSETKYLDVRDPVPSIHWMEMFKFMIDRAYSITSSSCDAVPRYHGSCASTTVDVELETVIQYSTTAIASACHQCIQFPENEFTSVFMKFLEYPVHSPLPEASSIVTLA
jgi:hypothetical protein